MRLRSPERCDKVLDASTLRDLREAVIKADVSDALFREFCRAVCKPWCMRLIGSQKLRQSSRLANTAAIANGKRSRRGNPQTKFCSQRRRKTRMSIGRPSAERRCLDRRARNRPVSPSRPAAANRKSASTASTGSSAARCPQTPVPERSPCSPVESTRLTASCPLEAKRDPATFRGNRNPAKNRQKLILFDSRSCFNGSRNQSGRAVRWLSEAFKYPMDSSPCGFPPRRSRRIQYL